MTDHPPSPQTRRRDRRDDGSTPTSEAAPSVFVSDDQGSETEHLPVDSERWQALASTVLTSARLDSDVELSVIFVDEAAMADLNERFMAHAGPTDVLAFPIDDDIPTPDPMPRLLGDVVICPSVAARNAPEHAGTYDDEIALLLVHGVLHLLGMDHADDDERIAMQTRERELLGAYHGPFARDPWS